MSNENEELKPLSLDDSETLKPLSIDTNEDNQRSSVPLSKTATNEIKNRDSNFVFFFGNPQSGKSVILSSIIISLKFTSWSFTTNNWNTKLTRSTNTFV
jgi:DNA replication protein DnaC